MDKKLYLISCVTSSLLLANDNVEIYSSGIDGSNSIYTTKPNPVVLYQDKILTADKIVYDQNSSTIEAFGSVKIFEKNKSHAIGEYANIKTQTNERFIKPFYMVDPQNQAWISSSEASSCEQDIDLKSGMVSGCDSDNPIWKFKFSSGNYNTDDMWINLFNVRLEIGDVPIFYLPYFGYSTDTTRRTGLLIPTLGVSSNEGFYYQQPIYFAPYNWWDLEFKPQIRTARGSGLYSDFRFVDTPSSSGFIRLGYFKERSSYAQKEDLKHLKHYGYDIRYSHTAPLKEWFDIKHGESGLYIDGSWMNDVEYLNLQNTDETENVTASQILSRINGYYSDDDNYYGIYMKHYQYLDRDSNAQTLQTLPTLHYHKYLESFWKNHLYFNGDISLNHFYRQEGKRALELNANVPVSLQTSIFNDYIDLSYSANLSAKAIGFYSNERAIEKNMYENGKYAQLDHIFSIGSSLIKPYDNNITHVINPLISFTKSSGRYYGGYYDRYKHGCDNTVATISPVCDFYTINNPTDTLSLGLNNYVFKDSKQILVDRLSQNINYDKNNRSSKGELVNELEWQLSDELYFYNQTAYNHDRKRVTKEQNTIRYNTPSLDIGISHNYVDELLDNKSQYSSYITGDIAYRYDKNYKFFGQIAYDYTESVMKKSEIGVLYSRRCLDLGVRFVQNRRPVLTNIMTTNYKDDNYIFISVVLKPIGGYDFNYKISGE